jgi:hypothetical protein
MDNGDVPLDYMVDRMARVTAVAARTRPIAPLFSDPRFEDVIWKCDLLSNGMVSYASTATAREQLSTCATSRTRVPCSLLQSSRWADMRLRGAPKTSRRPAGTL